MYNANGSRKFNENTIKLSSIVFFCVKRLTFLKPIYFYTLRYIYNLFITSLMAICFERIGMQKNTLKAFSIWFNF